MQKHIVFILAALLLAACSTPRPSDPEAVADNPQVQEQEQEHQMQLSTPEIVERSTGSVTISSVVSGAAGDSLIGMGICYDEQPMPTVLSTRLNSHVEKGTVQAEVSGLTMGKTYYFRAFAICDDAITYSGQVSFSMDMKVDLGLSVCWASCNVGASVPENYGNYYAWAETAVKSNYFWGTYKYSAGSFDTFSKYNRNFSSGNVDGRTEISPADDVASQQLKGTWRIPTAAEWQELCNKCTWTWTKVNGVNGYRITSEVPGYTDRSIFLPAAGHRNGANRFSAASEGFYWSSSLCTESSIDAFSCNFKSGIINPQFNCERFCGLSVRPVCE